MGSNSGAALLCGLLLMAATASPAPPAISAVSSVTPPPPLREFRGAWVATVGNIDWPSKAGLTTQQQKMELLGILDQAVHFRLNTIILQVRPGCDAVYASSLEPWSEYLTGQMGRAPAPFYDPLAFAVEEAHRRGLELHAWFNPFRAHQAKARSSIAPNHISRTHPQWVKHYGSQLWLDLGQEEVLDYSRQIILDVVKRYDIDGAHLDDYFYPYPERDARGEPLPFPDWASWKRYTTGGGKLTREDWRRENVNRFVKRLYEAIKAEKAFVKFGVSPFGIWRPGFPEQIRGLDAYDKLFTDSRQWLAQGWLDYLAPQLYWGIEPKEQSYPVLLKWWTEQNPKHRHLWPGDSPARIGPDRPASEIVSQISLTRQQPGAGGNIHWSMATLMQNRGGIADRLLNEVYTQPALIPASPWLAAVPPAAPKLWVDGASKTGTKLSWLSTNSEPAWLWLLQTKVNGGWVTEIFPGQRRAHLLKPNLLTEMLALTAVDRCGNTGPPTIWELLKPPK